MGPSLRTGSRSPVLILGLLPCFLQLHWGIRVGGEAVGVSELEKKSKTQLRDPVWERRPQALGSLAKLVISSPSLLPAVLLRGFQ